MAGTAGQQATEESQTSAREGEMAEEARALENPRKSDASREAE